MAEYLVIAPSRIVTDAGKGPQDIPAGTILDSDDYDIVKLRTQGAAIVPYDRATMWPIVELFKSQPGPSRDLLALVAGSGVPAFGGFAGRTSERLDLYVWATGGDDNNDGSAGAPLATLAEAWRRIPAGVDHPVVVHLSSGVHRWTTTLGPFKNRQPIAVVGDGAGDGTDALTELQAPAASAAGTGQYVIVDPTGGLAVNVYQRKTIEVLTGAAAGDRRLVRNNTANQIVPDVAFSAAVAPGDQFRIVESAVTIEYGSGPSIANGPIHIAGVGTPAFWERGPLQLADGYNESSLLLANMRFVEDGVQAATRFRVCGTALYCAGVEFGEASNAAYNVAADCSVYGGIDTLLVSETGSGFWLPFLLGLCQDAQSWLGWGLTIEGTTIEYLRTFKGFLVMQDNFTTGTSLSECEWMLLGGALAHTGATSTFDGNWDFRRHSRVEVRPLSGANLPFRIESVGGSDGSVCLKSSGGSTVRLRFTEVIITGQGIGIGAGGNHVDPLAPGVVELIEGNVISAPRIAVCANYGGKVFVRDDPSLTVAPSEAEVAVFQGRETSVPTGTGTLAGMAAAGAVVLGTQADGTVVMRVT